MQNRVTEEILLDPMTNRTGSVWHVCLKGDFEDMLYGYKLDGKFSPQEGLYYNSSRIVLDPYAKVAGLYESFFFLCSSRLCFYFQVYRRRWILRLCLA